MATITEEVDIDVDISDYIEELSTQELIDELSERTLSATHKIEVKGIIIGSMDYDIPNLSSVDDELKMKHLCEIWDKYTLDDLIKALP